MKRLHATIAALALLLGVASCAGEPPAPATTPAPVTTTQAAPSPTPEPSKAPEPSPSVASFEDYVAESYPGGVSWDDFITGAEEKFGTLWVYTNLYPDAEAEKPARAICTAGKFYTMEHPDIFTQGTVMVRAEGGMRVADC